MLFFSCCSAHLRIAAVVVRTTADILDVLAGRWVNIYTLFTGWEVRILKNCTRGLENNACRRAPSAAFSSPRSQFFTQTDRPWEWTCLFFPLSQITFMIFGLFHTHSHRARITVTVVKGRKIRTPLRSQWILQDWLPCSQKTKKHNLVNQSCFHFKTLHSAPYLSYCSFHLQIVLTSKEVFQYTTVIKVKDYNHELNGGVFANSIGLVISVN